MIEKKKNFYLELSYRNHQNQICIRCHHILCDMVIKKQMSQKGRIHTHKIYARKKCGNESLQIIYSSNVRQTNIYIDYTNLFLLHFE